MRGEGLSEGDGGLSKGTRASEGWRVPVRGGSIHQGCQALARDGVWRG